MWLLAAPILCLFLQESFSSFAVNIILVVFTQEDEDATNLDVTMTDFCPFIFTFSSFFSLLSIERLVFLIPFSGPLTVSQGQTTNLQGLLCLLKQIPASSVNSIRALLPESIQLISILSCSISRKKSASLYNGQSAAPKTYLLQLFKRVPFPSSAYNPSGRHSPFVTSSHSTP